jgi:hypothetical protein
MRLASAHATVHADVLVADHAHQVVLLSMAGPKTAVKAIHAALRSNHHPWLKLYADDSAEPVAVVRGGPRYRVRAAPLPSVRGAHMVAVTDDERAPAGCFYVLPDQPAGAALVRALDTDRRLVVPVLPKWGAYLLEQAQTTPTRLPDECPDGPDRLVEPLQVYGSLLAGAYAYARDNDAWLALVNRGLECGAIGLDAALSHPRGGASDAA